MKQLELRANTTAVANSISGQPLAFAEDRAASAIVEACQSLVVFRPDDGAAPVGARLPTAAERGVLAERQRDLALMLRPASMTDAERRKIGAAVADLLGGYPSLRNADTRDMVAGITKDLMALPAWAVLAALARVKRGAVAGVNPDFPPTSPRLYQLAAAELVPVHAEQGRIAETLTIQPRENPDSEEKARLAEKLADLAAELRANAAETNAEVRERQAENLRTANRALFERECAAAGIPIDSPVSPSLLRRLGAMA